MSALLSFPVGSTSFDALEHFPLPATAEEIAFEYAVDEFVTPESMAGWMESADHQREPSKYFGLISNEELWKVVFGRFSNAEQREQAAILLHMRFVGEHIEEIRQKVNQGV